MTSPATQVGCVEYRKVFEATPAPCLVLSSEFSILAANDAYLAATRTRIEDILGRNVFEVFPDNPDDPGAMSTARLRASLERVLDTHVADTMALQKYDIPAPGGGFEERYWSVVNAPVLDGGGHIAYFINRVEDVTDLARTIAPEAVSAFPLHERGHALAAESFRRGRELDDTNVRLRQANEALVQLDRTRVDFFNDLSHEFRTPLTLLLWSIDHLQRSADQFDEGQRKALTASKRNAERLLRLVNNLLDFARLESGRVKAVFRPTDLSRLTADLAAQFRAAIEQAGLQLHVDCPPLPKPVYVDREMWEKIVSNLLSNAFKFTLAGEIRVSVKAQGDRVELSVVDTGGGIPERELPRIFERFYRAKGTKARTAEGTGIGLSMVKELARLHGGEVKANSAVGQGSVFSVAIPLGRAHLPADSVEETPVADGLAPTRSPKEPELWPASAGDVVSAIDAAAGSRPRVLVVDDNVDVGVAISRLLGERFQTQIVSNGAAALKIVYDNPPDVVVTDLLMAGLGGLDLVRTIRADPSVSSLPIIIVSGDAAEESRSVALEAGADDFLVKPFSARELVARVNTQVEYAQRSRLERSLRAEAEASRGRMNMVLESVSEAFLAVDRSWRITFANGRSGDWLGKTREQLVYHPLEEALPDVARGELRAALQRAMGKREKAQLEQLFAKRWWKIEIYPTPEGLVLLAIDINERKAAEDKALHLARHDPLTGLPNRALLYELGEHMLAAARRSGSMLAVFFFDLDRFKPINDTYGHKIGDQVLQQVARRICQSMRKEDWVARLGGDEFVALLPNLHSADDAARAAAHAIEVLQPPIQVGSVEMHSSPSIGISVFPQDGDSIDALIQHADAAMYYAKELGGNGYQFFTKSIGRQAHDSLSIEQRLRKGIEGQELQLYYQPVVNTLTGNLTGVEALLRWPQPDKSNLSPDVFIPIAEATGLINPLGEWVFFEACRQHNQWQREGLPAIRVAVNVSAVQFRHRDFWRCLERVLREGDVSATCLLLELTESALMKDVGTSVKRLRAIRETGVQVALDDFGTGYSSLSQLTQLPLDKLKIDRSFIHNLTRGGPSPAIVEAIIALGRTLDLEIVAEGVETEQCLDFLRERECHHVQGFYLGHPMPAKEFGKWYRDRAGSMH